MNRKLFGLILPIFGGAVIVGTGFSAWHFSEQTVTINSTGTGKVTGLAENGKLTWKNGSTFTFVLDQGGKANAAALDKGITMSSNLAFNFLGNQLFEEDPTTVLAGYAVSYELSVDGPTKAQLLNYIELERTSDWIPEVKGTTTNADLTLPSLVYTNQKPQTAAAYKAMIDAIAPEAVENYAAGLSGLQIQIQVTVTASKTAPSN